MRSFRPREAPKSPVLSRIIPMKNRNNTDCAAPVHSARRITPDLCVQSRFTPDLGAVQAEQQKRTKNGDVFQAPSPASWDRRAPARHGCTTPHAASARRPAGFSAVTLPRHPGAGAGVQKPAGFPACADVEKRRFLMRSQPTGFLCDPAPCSPASSGSDPVRLHSANLARGIDFADAERRQEW